MCSTGKIDNQLSVYFKIPYEAPFGKAIFVVGNASEFGNWKLSSRNRLEWTEGHLWRKKFTVSKNSKIQYKYVVSDYDGNNDNIQWEVGKNRVIDQHFCIEKQIYLNEKWNLANITIELFTQSLQQIEEVYILGNCVELGMKISKRLMTKTKSNVTKTGFIVQNWQITFNIDKHKSCLNYYYYAQKKGKVIQKIRQPGKYYYLNQEDNNNLVDRQSIIYGPGNTKLIQKENFKGFKVSKLNDNIFIGPYVKKRQDIQVLKQNNVNAIFNLQSKEDMAKYKVDWDWIKEVSHQYSISAFNFQIVDMNFNDFINKSSQALKILRKLIDVYGCVYIHCTAGIYRSPQLAILYLVKFQNFQLQNALDLVKQKRPYAHPYVQCLKSSLFKIYHKIDHLKNHLSIKSFFVK